MAKTFLTYQQQLHILEHGKQLAIPDPDYAKKMLEEISYYSLPIMSSVKHLIFIGFSSFYTSQTGAKNVEHSLYLVLNS